MFFVRFLLSRPLARLLGIALIKVLRNSSIKSKIVLSTSAYARSCWIFCTGLARYLVTVPVALEVPPVIVSPVINCCCEVMNNLGVVAFPRSSTRTSAVALEVPPVIVSPTMNLPVVPVPLSNTMGLLSSSITRVGVLTSKRRLSIVAETCSSPDSRYL